MRSLLLAAALGALALIGASLALLFGPSVQRGGAQPRPESNSTPVVVTPHTGPASVVDREPAQDRNVAARVQESADPARGTLQVRVTGLPADAGFGVDVLVSEWRSHAGSLLAIRARAVLPAGKDSTELRLSSGSYSVRAVAPGLVSDARRVDLGVHAPHAQVALHLEVCGGVRGVLLLHDGHPAADVAVHAEDREGQWLGSTKTAYDGGYVLECLPLGPGRLKLGALAGPLTTPTEIDVGPSLVHVPDIQLPPMGRIVIEVRDEFGVAVPDLRLEGLSDSSMRLELRGDMSGTAICEHVPSGTWRIFADAGPLGRGNVAFDVTAGSETRKELRLLR